MRFPEKPKRTREDTASQTVPVYRFSEDTTIPDTIVRDLERYTKLLNLSKSWEEDHGNFMYEDEPNLVHEMSRILKHLELYDETRVREMHKSVLAHSSTVNEIKPTWRGADSHVYKHNTDKYVFKYSVYDQDPSPEAVEYLRKKYTLLKKYLGEHIPQTVFFFGEYRKGFNKHKPHGSFSDAVRIITIQRRIKGKTFGEMTPRERSKPNVLRALRLAHSKYIKAKKVVEKCNAELKKRGFGVDLKLDLGAISDKSNLDDDNFIIEKCKSPNIVYNEKEDKVYFIDFGRGFWSDDKEEVFNKIIKEND